MEGDVLIACAAMSDGSDALPCKSHLRNRGGRRGQPLDQRCLGRQVYD